MRLIGQECKRSDTLSQLILIGRGLDLIKDEREANYEEYENLMKLRDLAKG